MKNLEEVTGYAELAGSWENPTGKCEEVIAKEIANSLPGFPFSICRSYARLLGIGNSLWSIKEGRGLYALLFGRPLIQAYGDTEVALLEVNKRSLFGLVERARKKIKEDVQIIYMF